MNIIFQLSGERLYRLNVMEKNTILLPNGELMPIIGFGTWQVKFFYFISIFYIYTFNYFFNFFFHLKNHIFFITYFNELKLIILF